MTLKLTLDNELLELDQPIGELKPISILFPHTHTHKHTQT